MLRKLREERYAREEELRTQRANHAEEQRQQKATEKRLQRSQNVAARTSLELTRLRGCAGRGLGLGDALPRALPPLCGLGLRARAVFATGARCYKSSCG